MNRPGRAVAKLNLLLLAVLVACAFLAGCSGVQTIEVPREVKVQTPVPCVDPAKRPARPQLRTEADVMLMDRGRRTLALFADWLRLQSYAGELEAVVEACSRIKGSAGRPAFTKESDMAKTSNLSRERGG